PSSAESSGRRTRPSGAVPSCGRRRSHASPRGSAPRPRGRRTRDLRARLRPASARLDGTSLCFSNQNGRRLTVARPPVENRATMAELLFPASPEEAASLFGDGAGITVFAGGTILMPALTRGLVRPGRTLMLG